MKNFKIFTLPHGYSSELLSRTEKKKIVRNFKICLNSKYSPKNSNLEGYRESNIRLSVYSCFCKFTIVSLYCLRINIFFTGIPRIFFYQVEYNYIIIIPKYSFLIVLILESSICEAILSVSIINSVEEDLKYINLIFAIIKSIIFLLAIHILSTNDSFTTVVNDTIRDKKLTCTTSPTPNHEETIRDM